jgi:hypothetical protein
MSSIADAAGAAPVELIPMFWASTHVDVMKNIKMRARFFFMADFSAIYLRTKLPPYSHIEIRVKLISKNQDNRSESMYFNAKKVMFTIDVSKHAVHATAAKNPHKEYPDIRLVSP